MVNFLAQRGCTISILFAILCLSAHLSACQNTKPWDGNTFIVDYVWDSKITDMHVIDDSGKEVSSPSIRARIAEIANHELPPWIAASKLTLANGTFHIHFPHGQDAEIVEAAHGVEGAGQNFIKDPKVTELMIRAHEGRLDLVRKLIDSGESVNDADQLSDTALMAAVTSKKVEVLKFLVEHGANVNARNIDGETALTLSATSGQSDMVDELIKDGSIFDCNNPTDRATFEQVQRRGSKSLLQVLSKVGVNCSVRSQRQRTS